MGQMYVLDGAGAVSQQPNEAAVAGGGIAAKSSAALENISGQSSDSALKRQKTNAGVAFDFSADFIILAAAFSTAREHKAGGSPKELSLLNFGFDQNQTLALQV